MGRTRTYRDLEAWRRTMALARVVYMETGDMPRDESLTRQIRKAAVSIPSGIASGFERRNRDDLLQAIRLAMGTLHELETRIDLATSLELLSVTKDLNLAMNAAHQAMLDLHRRLSP